MLKICTAWKTERCRWTEEFNIAMKKQCPHSIPHEASKICNYGSTDDKYGCPSCENCIDWDFEENEFTL